MSWKICPACKGKCYIICKDSDGNEIPHKCPVCDSKGEIFVDEVNPYRWWSHPCYPCYPISPCIESDSTGNWPPDGIIIQYQY